ncbi:MAG: hypothetical protein JSW27_15475 [Phycisphaerales bacterium]|nr:MAG: hypothetical protein JSW27_15475 [Phycisphaerales bacterium]
MKRRQTALLVGLILLAAGVSLALAGSSQGGATDDIWEDTSGPSRRPRWHRWFSDEMIERIMKGIRQRDPEKAKELAELRKKDFEQFKSELGRHGRKEIEQISRERFEAWRRRRQAEFIAWLETNYPEQEKELAKLKEKDPQLYVKSYENLEGKYGRIFDADNANPELGAVLKEDLLLKERRDELIRRFRHERSGAKRQAIGSELQEVVARRYDLIVRRKEIAYEELQKKLEDIQKQIKGSKNEIVRWQDAETRLENIRRRVEALTEGKMRFKWD